MQKRIVALILAILVLAAAIVYFLNRNGRNPGNQIVVSGNIELTEVNIAFKTAGRLIERSVDEGDIVKKGQVIARLDQDQLLAQRNREDAGLQSARSLLAQAETALAWQRGNQAAELEQRRAELASYQARLQELKSGSRPEEIQEAKAAVDSAQAEYDRAKRDWERAQTLYKNDDISTAQYDQYRSRWENAEAMLKQIKERQALVLAGPRKEQIEAAEAQVERARAALKMAESNALEIKRREQELPLRQAEIARASANLALIESQLADTVAVSPVDGVVLVKAADVGEVLAAGTTVVTIGDIDHPWLRAYINETDLGRIKLGTRAKVTTDSYPGKEYEGRVSFIASEAEFTPKQIQTQEERVKLVYRIKIDLDNPNHELKSNMPADAVLILE
ncbi:MAG: HlyD family efflux transporter periplasmic adaptor subunit [Acidobacteriota bacterium]|jgi:HlyD family secretion protein|nr:HlyD family efflux transporter periplasmic adaptor subunit [Acidobacteriota bacterium]